MYISMHVRTAYVTIGRVDGLSLKCIICTYIFVDIHEYIYILLYIYIWIYTYSCTAYVTIGRVDGLSLKCIIYTYIFVYIRVYIFMYMYMWVCIYEYLLWDHRAGRWFLFKRTAQRDILTRWANRIASMCIFIYIYIHIHIFILYVSTYINKDTYISIYTYYYTHIYIRIHIYIYMYILLPFSDDDEAVPRIFPIEVSSLTATYSRRVVQKEIVLMICFKAKQYLNIYNIHIYTYI
jgi:hypothetical protein